MDFRQAVLIYNPTSGRKRDGREKMILQARDALKPTVGDVHLARTSSQGHATRLAIQAVADGCDLIAVCGGDGTINETICGMAGSDVPLLTLPAGTANVLAEEVSFPVDPRKVAAALPSLVATKVPLGRVVHGDGEASRFFLLMCGVGVDANIVYNLDTKLKEYFGQGAYWLGTLEHLQHRRFQRFDVRIDGETYENTFALISKSRRYAGKLVIAPEAHLLAEHFQVVLFHGETSLRYVGYLAQAATQTLDQFEDVTFHHTDRVEILAPADGDIHIEVDGEYAGRLPAVVETVPDGLTLLLPPGYVERRPPPLQRAEAVSSVSRL
jgi:YegS/Rv2252/BmrU family lipid kinase